MEKRRRNNQFQSQKKAISVNLFFLVFFESFFLLAKYPDGNLESPKMDRIFSKALVKFAKTKGCKNSKKKTHKNRMLNHFHTIKEFLSIFFYWCNKIKVYLFTCGLIDKLQSSWNFVQCKSLKLIEPPGNDSN